MTYDPLQHPEDWVDFIMIVPPSKHTNECCTKCANKKMGECLGEDKCPLIK